MSARVQGSDLVPASSMASARMLRNLKSGNYIPKQNWLTIILVAMTCGCGAPKQQMSIDKDLIAAGAPLFDLFELSNSAGGNTFTSSEGKVYLSFATDDSRYCRAARVPSENAAILACRIEGGWQIEARSEFASSGAASNAGGGTVTTAINDAISRLNANGQLLNEREIVAAAGKG